MGERGSLTLSDGVEAVGSVAHGSTRRRVTRPSTPHGVHTVIGMPELSVYPNRDLAHEDTAVPPVREVRSTDASTLSLPIAWVVGIVITVGGFGVSQAMSVAGMRSDVRDILTRMEYESKLRQSEADLLEAKFKALDAQITSAGLRNFNMAQAQQLSNQKAK